MQLGVILGLALLVAAICIARVQALAAYDCIDSTPENCKWCCMELSMGVRYGGDQCICEYAG